SIRKKKVFLNFYNLFMRRLHELAEKFNLEHWSSGTDKSRYVTVSKKPKPAKNQTKEKIIYPYTELLKPFAWDPVAKKWNSTSITNQPNTNREPQTIKIVTW